LETGHVCRLIHCDSDLELWKFQIKGKKTDLFYGVYGYRNIINYALLVTANSKHYKKAEISYRFGSEKVYTRRLYRYSLWQAVLTFNHPQDMNS